MKIFGGYYKYLILSVFFEIIFYDQRIVPPASFAGNAQHLRGQATLS